LCAVIGSEALRFEELLSSDKLSDREKELYEQLITVDKTGQGVYAMPQPVLMGSLRTLTVLLEKHYGRKVILLIDEYDVPLAKAKKCRSMDIFSVFPKRRGRVNRFTFPLFCSSSRIRAVLST